MKNDRWRRSVYPQDPPGDVGGLLCVAAVVAEVLVASDWFRCIFGIAAAGGLAVAAILRKASRDATAPTVTEVTQPPPGFD